MIFLLEDKAFQLDPMGCLPIFSIANQIVMVLADKRGTSINIFRKINL